MSSKNITDIIAIPTHDGYRKDVDYNKNKGGRHDHHCPNPSIEKKNDNSTWYWILIIIIVILVIIIIAFYAYYRANLCPTEKVTKIDEVYPSYEYDL